MAAEKTLAIVLRVVEFSETSCVVTLFTRQFGKISGLAKGARRKKSPFEAALDVLSICHLVFLRKSSDALHLLTEAKLERRFRAAARDLRRWYTGLYVVELLMALTDEGDPHPDLFELAAQTIAAIDDAGDPDYCLVRFQLRMLAMVGHRPELRQCIACGKTVMPAQRAPFALAGGGLLCTGCRSGQRHVASVTWPTLQFMQSLAEPDAAICHPTWTEIQRGETRGVLDQYISHLIGYRPKMASLLRHN